MTCFTPDDPRLTAYALGELEAAECAEVEVWLAANPNAQQQVEEVRALGRLMGEQLRLELTPKLADDQKQRIVRESELHRPLDRLSFWRGGSWRRATGLGLLAASLLLAGTVPFWSLLKEPQTLSQKETVAAGGSLAKSVPGSAAAVVAPSRTDNIQVSADAPALARYQAPVANYDDSFELRMKPLQGPADSQVAQGSVLAEKLAKLDADVTGPEVSLGRRALRNGRERGSSLPAEAAPAAVAATLDSALPAGLPDSNQPGSPKDLYAYGSNAADSQPGLSGGMMGGGGSAPHRVATAGAAGGELGTNGPASESVTNGVTPEREELSRRSLARIAPQAASKPQVGELSQGVPAYSLKEKAQAPSLPAVMLGGKPSASGVPGQQGIMSESLSAASGNAGPASVAAPQANPSQGRLSVALGFEAKTPSNLATATRFGRNDLSEGRAGPRDEKLGLVPSDPAVANAQVFFGEPVSENAFVNVGSESRLSTFAVDVDTGSYSSARNFLRHETLPPPASVRIEEFMNYFTWNDPAPTGAAPVSVQTELTRCPWNSGNWLLRVGLKGKAVTFEHRQPSNLVFLVDVSGSMNQPNKLPLAKTGLRMLVEQLGENDTIALATFAGSERVALPPTSGANKAEILSAIDQLSATGSTNGEAGYKLAYDLAVSRYIQGGINRVILCSDGDFNVGATKLEDLTAMATAKAKTGVFLNVLGFGEGNLQEKALEQLADQGNGQYAYIDDLLEAKKVFIDQIDGTLVTIAKDVKVQVEFQPERVGSFRLLGYENRLMAAQDFRNDARDAGEIGSGHTVTALYELTPAQAAGQPAGGDLAVVRFRYKAPEGTEASEILHPVPNAVVDLGVASSDTRFASAVAMFGMILRNSAYRGDSNLDAVLELARANLGTDPGGYRAEFVGLVEQAKKVMPAPPAAR